MKKVLLFAVAASVVTGVATTAGAQERGEFWLGGQFGYHTAGTGDAAPTRTFTFEPEFGYNLSERWGVGIELGLHGKRATQAAATVPSLPDYWRPDGAEQWGVAGEDGSSSRHSARTLSIAPFARYTFVRWRSVRVYADGGIVYSQTRGEFDLRGRYSDVTTRYGGLFVNPGFAFHLTRCVALTGSVNLLKVGTSRTTSFASFDETALDASLNSPFTPGALRLGFHVSF